MRLLAEALVSVHDQERRAREQEGMRGTPSIAQPTRN
jgi:hypothetical protein